VSSFFGLSLEEPLAESEYLRRELNVEWHTSSQEEIFSTISENSSVGNKTLIIVSTVDIAFNLVRRSPANSIVLLILSDEAYSTNAYKLARLDSVYSVMRNYSITSQPKVRYLKTAKSVFGKYLKSTTNRYLAPVEVGLVLAWYIRNNFVMSKWRRLKKPLSILPLGYTNKFAKSFSSLMSIGDGKSLLMTPTGSVSERAISISFSGTRGSVQRRTAIDFLGDIPGSHLSVNRNGWNGHESSGTDVSYCQILLSSSYCAALPGHISNESFRYYEALVCGALPIRFHLSLGQGALDTTISQQTPAATRIEDFQDLINISESDRSERVVELTSEFRLAMEQNGTFLSNCSLTM
jgi:hypothetical protein